jgi:hypothetical protein
MAENKDLGEELSLEALAKAAHGAGDVKGTLDPVVEVAMHEFKKKYAMEDKEKIEKILWMKSEFEQRLVDEKIKEEIKRKNEEEFRRIHGESVTSQSDYRENFEKWHKSEFKKWCENNKDIVYADTSLGEKKYLNLYAVALRGLGSSWVLDTSGVEGLLYNKKIAEEVKETLAIASLIAQEIQDSVQESFLEIIADSIANFQRSYNVENDSEFFQKNYKFCLMSDLPDGDPMKAHDGKIYFSENGDYVVFNSNDKEIKIGRLSSEDGVDLSALTNKITCLNSIDNVNRNIRNRLKKEFKGPVLKALLKKNHVVKYDINEQDQSACGDGTAGIIFQAMFPFLSEEDQAALMNWGKNFNGRRFFIHDDIAINLLSEKIKTLGFSSVKNIFQLNESSAIYKEFKEEFLGKVRDGMVSLSGYYKPQEIVSVKKTDEYKRYFDQKEFSYIDMEAIFEKLINRNIYAFAVARCNNLNQWSNFLSEGKYDLFKKEVRDILAGFLSLDKVDGFLDSFDYSFFKNEISRFQGLGEKEKEDEKANIEIFIKEITDPDALETQCIKKIKEIEEKFSISFMKSIADQQGGWEKLKEFVKRGDDKNLYEEIQQGMHGEVIHLFNSQPFLKDTAAYKAYLDSKSISSEINLKQIARKAMANKMLTLVACYVMGNIGSVSLDVFLNSNRDDGSRIEKIKQFILNYFDEEDLGTYETFVSLRGLKEEITRIRFSGNSYRKAEMERSHEFLVVLSEKKFLSKIDYYIKSSLENAISAIINARGVLGNFDEDSIVKEINETVKVEFKKSVNRYYPDALSSDAYSKYFGSLSFQWSEIEPHFLKLMAQNFMDLAFCHFETYTGINKKINDDDKKLSEGLEDFISEFIVDNEYIGYCRKYWNSGNPSMVQHFRDRVLSLRDIVDIDFGLYNEITRSKGIELIKLSEKRFKESIKEIELTASKSVLKEYVNKNGFQSLKKVVGNVHQQNMILSSINEKMKNLMDKYPYFKKTESYQEYFYNDKYKSIDLEPVCQEIIFDIMLSFAAVSLKEFFGDSLQDLLSKNDPSVKEMAGDFLSRFFSEDDVKYFLDNFSLDKLSENIKENSEVNGRLNHEVTELFYKEVTRITIQKREGLNKGYIHESFDFESVAKNLSPKKRNDIEFALGKLMKARKDYEKPMGGNDDIKNAELDLKKILFNLSNLKQEIDSKKQINKPLLKRILAGMLDLVIVTGETSLNLEIKRIESELKNSKPKNILEKLIAVFVKLIDAFRKFINNTALTVKASIKNLEGYENTKVPNFLRQKKKPKH